MRLVIDFLLPESSSSDSSSNSENTLISLQNLSTFSISSSLTNQEYIELDVNGTPSIALTDGALRGLLSSTFASLRPGGELRVTPFASSALKNVLIDDAVLCGFITDNSTGVLKRPAFAAVSKLRTRLPTTLLEGKSSTETTTSSSSITSKVTLVLPKVSVPSTTWASAAKNLNANADLIDEDSLLLDSASAAAFSTLSLSSASAAAKDGDESCAPKKRACKNCSCGRKEMEEAEDIVKLKDVADGVSSGALSSSAVPSACGSCSKGDAFRCATCPSRGKPAWKTDSNTGNVMIDMASDL